MSFHTARFSSSRLTTFVSGILGLTLSIADGAGAARASETDGEIVVSVSELRNASGVVRIALYAREGEWLSRETVSDCVAQVHGEHARCSLGVHAPGTYAIAVLHDEDADGDMDRDFIGLPQEGYGFSSGARPGFGPPSFGDASFEHGASRSDVPVRARYGL
ncbi:MAG: DUF2141 domain-containing protein [Deltaproteobacteria bacterium]|nr:DUF2141 domain-containing protein [Deltaproteobacteria bacterium]